MPQETWKESLWRQLAHKVGNLFSKLQRLINRNQVAASFDDFEPGIRDASDDLALVLFNRIELIEFTRED
jgi:hypothetical protein